MTNLARDRTDTTRAHAGRVAVRVDNAAMTYRALDEASARVAGLLHERGLKPGDRVDLARVDEDGYFYIVERKKDLIIRGSYNVYPREIEEVLYEHPAVAEAAVMGLPHSSLGEEVGAAVALKPGAAISAGELRDYVKSLVAAYKYPRHMWIWTRCPRVRPARSSSGISSSRATFERMRDAGGVTLRTVTATDYHTAGEPFRIVTDPPVALPGVSVADRRVRAIGSPDAQGLRELLCFEPRGHADMYGGFLVPPDDDGACLGVLFWHKDGFSTACGHGTIALGAWVVDTGLVQAPQDGIADVVIDVPSGRVTARVHRERGRTVAVDFVNVPSYVLARDIPLATSRGQVAVTVAYGGAIYASLDAASAGLTVDASHYRELIALGREVKWALNDTGHAVHPVDSRLSGVYGAIVHEDLGSAGGQVHQRNVTVFADGEVDRSPCGSGTCARLAVLAAQGRVAPTGPALRHESIVGSVFTGTVVAATTAAGRPAIVPQVTGMAYRTGEHTFVVDPADPLVPGFVLR